MNLSDFNPITAVLGTVADVAQKYFPDPETKARFMADIERQAAEVDLQREKVAADDRASARAREAARGDNTARNLVYVYTVGFFAVLGAQFYCALAGIRIHGDVLRTIDITTGVLFAFVMAGKDYFLGSSAGSKAKTDLLGKR